MLWYKVCYKSLALSAIFIDSVNYVNKTITTSTITEPLEVGNTYKWFDTWESAQKELLKEAKLGIRNSKQTLNRIKKMKESDE